MSCNINKKISEMTTSTSDKNRLQSKENYKGPRGILSNNNQLRRHGNTKCLCIKQ